MAKNLIPEIAKMLGVELGEEFKVKGAKGADGTIFWFDLDGLHAETCEMADVTLWQLVLGNETIIKLPWKPKEGDTFYSFDIRYGKWVVCSYMWVRVPCDYALLDKGWIYRTKEAAQAALPDVAKELDVEYEL